MLAGESLLRQFDEGVRWTRHHLGVSPQVMLAPDTFGHSGNLPQMAAGHGVRIHYHHRANFGQKDVEGLGTAVYRPSPAAPPVPAGLVGELPEVMMEGYPGARPEGRRYLRVETDHLTVVVRRDSGIICSLVDRRSGCQLVGFGMRRGSDYFDTARADLALGVLQLLEEDGSRHLAMSGWHLDEVRSERSFLSGAEVEVVEDGPVRCVLAWTHRVGQSSVELRLVARREIPRIDYAITVHWRERASSECIPNLVMSFCSEMAASGAWFETPYSVSERPAGGQEVPATRWAACGGDHQTLAVLNSGRSGHSALGSRIRVNRVRSAANPDPDSGLGRHATRLSLLPVPAHWRSAQLTRRAMEINQPLIARPAPAPAAPVARPTTAPPLRPRLCGDGSVVVSAVRRAHDGSGWMVRLAETVGVRARAKLRGIPPGCTVHETALDESRPRLLEVAEGAVEVGLGPHQILSLRVGGEE